MSVCLSACLCLIVFRVRLCVCVCVCVRALYACLNYVSPCGVHVSVSFAAGGWVFGDLPLPTAVCTQVECYEILFEAFDVALQSVVPGQPVKSIYAGG